MFIRMMRGSEESFFHSLHAAPYSNWINKIMMPTFFIKPEEWRVTRSKVTAPERKALLSPTKNFTTSQNDFWHSDLRGLSFLDSKTNQSFNHITNQSMTIINDTSVKYKNVEICFNNLIKYWQTNTKVNTEKAKR